MLSSWCRRIAAEYDVSLHHLAQHLGLSAWRPVQIDHALTRDDIERTAAALTVAPAEIQAMVHHPLKTSVWRLRERYTPVQVCARCRADHVSKTNQPVTIMALFEYWRIECQQCSLPFSDPGGPKLKWSNPAREEPEWFKRILPFARQGAAQLVTFVRRPDRSLLSPVAVLRLLSMRLNTCGASTLRPTWRPHHRIAELFLPARSAYVSEHPLLPAPWTKQHPVRLVTARTVLFAAMAKFLADPRAAYARIVGALDWRRRSAVERWWDDLPEHSARILHGISERSQSNSAVSHLQQI